MNKQLIVGVMGGGSAKATDADTAYSLGLNLVELSDDTLEQLDEICPPNWSRRNPVDIIGDATASRYDDALKIMMNAKEVDAVVLLLSPKKYNTMIHQTALIIRSQLMSRYIIAKNIFFLNIIGVE